MDSIIITGGNPLFGCIEIAGAKNSCLALMPLSILTEETLNLQNVPRLVDISTMSILLRTLGIEVCEGIDSNTLKLKSGKRLSSRAEYDIVRKMRASFLVLGPLLARTGRAEVSLPGGCAIGARGVDLHLMAMEKLGARLELRDGYVYASASGGLHGAAINFPTISVGATENTLMASVLAQGITTINNAACEPEIIDLAKCLLSMGAKIQGIGTPHVTVQGVKQLSGCSHTVVADRIELGTYMLATAITGGDMLFTRAHLGLVSEFASKLVETGVEVDESESGIHVRSRQDRLQPVNMTTAPHPGFPTDLQAQMMAAMTLADGESTIVENIFENRFMHVPELRRMGANISLQGSTAKISGVDSLRGAPVMATDLRASVALILAGLAAKGQTRINRVYHLDRGYESVEKKLSACGADIVRIRE